MSDTSPSELQQAIQQSLQAIALQMSHPLDTAAAAGLYQEASGLLAHLSPEPLTLARVAGTLLVYQRQATSPEELVWFRLQVQQCLDDEAVEELIESIHRVDAL